ncbi:dihydropteroate synthase [Flavobacteriales bacterium]|nr:dihydropteroate synthase [Flavobacteriales bacterium]
MPKDTFFSEKISICCRGSLLNLDEPLIMGILNLTPDSFYDGGLHTDSYLLQVEKMMTEGASIIDVGGQSTRPGAIQLNPDEEKKRILPAIENIVKRFPECILSVDTFWSDVAESAIESGVAIINDISGGEFDHKMLDVVAKLKVPYIVMHTQGSPENMQLNPVYTDVVKEVCFSLASKTEKMKLLGINDVLIDPGFGFGKNIEHNYTLLNYLEHFNLLEKPVLIGVSRKSMINKLLHTQPKNALNGTSIIHTLALIKGAKILRVHDVKEAVEAIKIVEYMQKN